MDEIGPAEFNGHEFDAKDFVQRFRRRLPLNQLQKALQSHHGATRQELVELINEKYADFVSLSSRMQGVERALRPLRAPLEESSELTRGLQVRLGSLLEEAEEAHTGLARARERRHMLTKYIENAKLLAQAKASVASRRSNPQEADGFLREHTAHENIARDLRRIRLNLGGRPRSCAGAIGVPTTAVGGATGDVEMSPECAALLAETATFEEEFAGKLQERLRVLLGATRRFGEVLPNVGGNAGETVGRVSGPPPRIELLAIAHLCRALVTLGRPDMVEAVFAEIFTKPALDQAAAACDAASQQVVGDAAPSIVAAGSVVLSPFFNAASASLLADDAPFIFFVRCLRGHGGAGGDDASVEGAPLAVPSLRLVSNSVVGPLLQFVQQTWPNIFMPSFPDVFAGNYAHAGRFLAESQPLMLPAERQAFASGSVLTGFQRRWKTQVYSSLRAMEALQRLETVSKAGDGSVGFFSSGSAGGAEQKHSAGGRKFWLEISAEVLRLLHQVWGDKWYLDALFPKTMQLSLELLGRYADLVRSGIASYAAAGAGDASGWEAAANPPAWSSISAPVCLPRIAADLLEILAEVRCEEAGSTAGASGATAGMVLLRASTVGDGSSDSQVPGVARAILAETGSSLRPVLTELETITLHHLAAASTPQFAAIRGIPALYRMTNKPVPTRPSPYVESALKPILAFHEIASRNSGPSSVVTDWVRNAIDAASAEFGVQAAQLLESAQQQEASLRRLVKKTAGADADVTDLEKIQIQLCIDVDHFASTTSSSLGAGVAVNAAGLAKLAEVVSPVRQVYETHRKK